MFQKYFILVKDFSKDAEGKILRKVCFKMPEARFCERCVSRCRRQDSAKDDKQEACG
jgi:hypothetical protein